MYKNKNGGFSLLELIVVIAIMAVLGGIVIGNSNYSKSAQVKKYTELTDGFMRKARTEIMSKNTVSGVCLYEKEGCYYIESYKEKENGGTVTFETVKQEKLGKPHGVEISAAKQDGTGEKTLRDNAGDSLSTFIRIGYDRSTGAVSKVLCQYRGYIRFNVYQRSHSKKERTQNVSRSIRQQENINKSK